MRIPRNISGRELIKKLENLGYYKTRQVGSHIRISTQINGAHHITIPDHKPLRIGTVSSLLTDVCNHLKLPKEELINKLFG